MASVCDLSATEQSASIQNGELSARELLAASLARIEATNGQVNAIVTLDAEAAERAAHAADAAFAAGRLLGPLHGLTLAVKDLHATRGMRTTYGSPALADFVSGRGRIGSGPDAGGRGDCRQDEHPEFGAGSHTFNAVFGLTRNPFALDRSAGGSSGGSARNSSTTSDSVRRRVMRASTTRFQHTRACPASIQLGITPALRSVIHLMQIAAAHWM